MEKYSHHEASTSDSPMTRYHLVALEAQEHPAIGGVVCPGSPQQPEGETPHVQHHLRHHAGQHPLLRERLDAGLRATGGVSDLFHSGRSRPNKGYARGLPASCSVVVLASALEGGEGGEGDASRAKARKSPQDTGPASRHQIYEHARLRFTKKSWIMRAPQEPTSR